MRLTVAPKPLSVRPRSEQDITDSEDDVTQTLVECAADDEEQVFLDRQIGLFIPGNLVSKMMESIFAWAVVVKLTEEIMSCKKQAERTICCRH